MKKFLLLFTAILFSISVLYAENADQGGEVYIVQPGDTLWDLAQQFYHNPWLWPRIWEANPYISNPQLIYPGKPLAIPKIMSGPPPSNIESTTFTSSTATAVTPSTSNLPKPVTGVTVPPPVEGSVTPPSGSTGNNMEQVAKPVGGEELPPPPVAPQEQVQTMPQETSTMPVAEEQPTIQTIVIPQPPPIHYFVRIGSEGFISRYELKSYGRIVASDSKKLLYAQGDYLYINMGESAGIINGDKFVVFEMLNPVSSPRYGKKVGYLVRVKGFLKVVDVYKDTSKVYVTQSFGAIMIGDSIRPFEQFPHHIEITKSQANVNGYIIGTIDNRNAVGEGDVIYLDIGKNDNVEIGNIVEIYKPARVVYDPVKDMKEHIPPLLVGKAVILSTQELTSVALIVQSYREIYKDYRVRITSEY